MNDKVSNSLKKEDAFLTECGSWRERTFSTERYIPDGMWRSIAHQHATICHTQTHYTYTLSYITQPTYEKMQPENTHIRYKILPPGIPSGMHRPVEKEMHTCQTGIPSGMHRSVEKNRKPKPCIPSGMHPVNNRKMIK